jgi:hypothetical protein
MKSICDDFFLKFVIIDTAIIIEILLWFGASGTHLCFMTKIYINVIDLQICYSDSLRKKMARVLWGMFSSGGCTT